MFTIIVLIILLLGFYQGYRQGLAMQLIRLLGYLISFFVASRYYEAISKWAEMLIPFPAIQPDTEFTLYNEATSFLINDAFYRVVSFIFILVIGYIVTRIVSVFFSRVQYYNLLDSANGIAGGIVNLLITYIMVFLLLFVLSLLPIEWIQQQFVNNPLLYWIVSQTPILSDLAANAWLNANPFS
ncbi:CvpA family protein [Ignavigranum ruoffiae]|uniref:Uncharacterized membrane protein, required for colicin V production n=1 Tax=Ignavigranum ruoffiae TaxID=89093 RepID=A0A1H9A2Q1_9LACT|nr:CvpA family protein [Ignavigranum ruoffiae]UPQ85715.1 CvpA family protein [Ignavigranum ruoffiae]SEP70791.1 Uncharacterized membrane protein, required for colicin V production [Ignavigranum ruoffiae]